MVRGEEERHVSKTPWRPGCAACVIGDLSPDAERPVSLAQAGPEV